LRVHPSDVDRHARHADQGHDRQGEEKGGLAAAALVSRLHHHIPDHRMISICESPLSEILFVPRSGVAGAKSLVRDTRTAWPGSFEPSGQLKFTFTSSGSVLPNW